MAITLQAAKDRVRAKTRHAGDTVRLTDSNLEGFLYDNYKGLRSWLQDVAPGLYVITVSNLTVTAAEPYLTLSSATCPFERLLRVERYWEDSEEFLPVERATLVSPNEHMTQRLTFREEGCRLVFGPDNHEDIPGEYRVSYYPTPLQIEGAGDNFSLPAPLEKALIYLTCADVAEADGDDPAIWEERASNHKGTVKTTLTKRHGAAPSRGGLQRRMGY